MDHRAPPAPIRARPLRLAPVVVLAGLAVLFAATPWARPPTDLQVVPGRPAAPGLALHDTEGRAHRLDAYAGRVVVINFWATWCGPCREEIPALNRAAAALGDAAAFLAVNIGEDTAAIAAFTAAYPIHFPVLLDVEQATIRAWPVLGLPTTFVLDPDGRIVYRATGDRAWDDESVLARLRALAR